MKLIFFVCLMNVSIQSSTRHLSSDIITPISSTRNVFPGTPCRQHFHVSIPIVTTRFYFNEWRSINKGVLTIANRVSTRKYQIEILVLARVFPWESSFLRFICRRRRLATPNGRRIMGGNADVEARRRTEINHIAGFVIVFVQRSQANRLYFAFPLFLSLVIEIWFTIARRNLIDPRRFEANANFCSRVAFKWNASCFFP